MTDTTPCPVAESAARVRAANPRIPFHVFEGADWLAECWGAHNAVTLATSVGARGDASIRTPTGTVLLGIARSVTH